jgi:hypothetical protein
MKIMSNSGEAQDLFDGLHKTYHPVEEPVTGYKGPGKGRGKSRGPAKKRKA